MTNRIGIERYMGIRTANNPTYDGAGQRLYFLSNMTGQPQVWTVEPGTPWPKQVTFMSEHVSDVIGSPTAEQVVVVADMNGSERSQLYLMSPDGLKLENLTQDPEHIYTFGAWSPDGTQFSYHTNKRNGRAFDVYIYNVETGEHKAVHESDYTNYSGFFTPDQAGLVFARVTSNVNNDLYRLDLHTGETTLLTPHDGDATFRPAMLTSDGETMLLVSDRGGEFIRLAALHLPTNAWVWLSEDQWDAESLAVSRDGRYLSYVKNVSGTSCLYLEEILSTGGAQVKLKRVEHVPDLPNGVIADSVWNPQRAQLAVTVSSPLHGTEVWTVDMETKTVERMTFNSISGVPQETFVEPELISYTSFDGLEIPAYYYRPEGVNGAYPVIVHVHGGPEAQARNGFNPYFQYFVRLGFAVLVPNVRGSAGYGRTYVQLDDVRKRMDSVADLAACVDWLVEHGNANRDAIAVMGGSYGGFMTLAAVTHYPDLWAAGVDIVGISNLRTFIENTSGYRRHLRESEYGTIEADGDFFDEISPIHHVDKIVAPMLVIHGVNDPRVPVSEADQIVEALQQRNQPVQYLRFDDEGHGVVKLANRITTYTEVADFLLKHLILQKTSQNR